MVCMDQNERFKKLSEGLAGELGAIVRYITYAAKATGPFRPLYFLAEETVQIPRDWPL